jgi:hypothetical protein
VAQLVDQVQLPHNQLAGVLVLDTGQLNVFKHGGVCLPAYAKKREALNHSSASPSLLR